MNADSEVMRTYKKSMYIRSSQQTLRATRVYQEKLHHRAKVNVTALSGPRKHFQCSEIVVRHLYILFEMEVEIGEAARTPKMMHI